MTADERKDAEIYIASKLGTDPTPEELMEFCVRSHAKRRRLERGLDTFDRWFRIVCKRGDFAQRQNFEYLSKRVFDYTKGHPTDRIYRLADVREILRAFDKSFSDATLKRRIQQARDEEVIGADDSEPTRRRWTRLTRDELLEFVMWAAPTA